MQTIRSDGVRPVALDLEAGAEALEACHSKPMNRDITRGIISAILAACNIIVPDEVVESAQHGCIATKHRGDVLDAEVLFVPGDTITITRESILQPQVKRER